VQATPLQGQSGQPRFFSRIYITQSFEGTKFTIRL
jgi:hypothetical protein